MLSYFRMNVSHNLLSKLSSNYNASTKDLYIQSNIRVNLKKEKWFYYLLWFFIF